MSNKPPRPRSADARWCQGALIALRADLWATEHQNQLGSKGDGHEVDRGTWADQPNELRRFLMPKEKMLQPLGAVEFLRALHE